MNTPEAIKVDDEGKLILIDGEETAPWECFATMLLQCRANSTYGYEFDVWNWFYFSKSTEEENELLSTFE